MPTETKWSTSDTPGFRALDAWNKLVSEKVIGLDIESDAVEGFRGELTEGGLGNTQSFLIFAGDDQRVSRATYNRQSNAGDAFILIHMRRGWLDLNAGSGPHRINVGDCVLLSERESFDFESPAGTCSMVLRFSRGDLCQRFPFVEHSVGERIDGRKKWGRTLSSAMWNIELQPSESWRFPPGEVSEQVAGLLGLALAPINSQISRASLTLYPRIEDEISARFDDPELTPSMVATSIGISKRYLHDVIAQRGVTFNKLLYAKRIAHACRLLRDGRNRVLTITEVAYASGFANPAHFSRVFRSQCGMSPRQYRTRC